jgi:hypothetical protein
MVEMEHPAQRGIRASPMNSPVSDQFFGVELFLALGS